MRLCNSNQLNHTCPVAVPAASAPAAARAAEPEAAKKDAVKAAPGKTSSSTKVTAPVEAEEYNIKADDGKAGRIRDEKSLKVACVISFVVALPHIAV